MASEDIYPSDHYLCDEYLPPSFDRPTCSKNISSRLRFGHLKCLLQLIDTTLLIAKFITKLQWDQPILKVSVCGLKVE